MEETIPCTGSPSVQRRENDPYRKVKTKTKIHQVVNKDQDRERRKRRLIGRTIYIPLT